MNPYPNDRRAHCGNGHDAGLTPLDAAAILAARASPQSDPAGLRAPPQPTAAP
jgi:hypothetical protein